MIPNKELRGFVYLQLYNNVEDGVGNGVPVFSLPASETNYPYIHLDSINLTNESAKDNLAYTARFTIQIYDQYQEELANWTRSEEIGSNVVNLLNKLTGDTTNWNIIIAIPESFDQQEQITETKRALLTTIVMNYYVEYKN